MLRLFRSELYSIFLTSVLQVDVYANSSAGFALPRSLKAKWTSTLVSVSVSAMAMQLASYAICKDVFGLHAPKRNVCCWTSRREVLRTLSDNCAGRQLAVDAWFFSNYERGGMNPSTRAFCGSPDRHGSVLGKPAE